jgi:hypothetical protein
MNLKASFLSHLLGSHPQLSSAQLEPLISENLISPFQVELKAQQVDQIREQIAQYWRLRQWSAEKLHEKYAQMQLRKPDNYAVCMSYDFHINSDGKPELIEINTNAAFLALGLELYRFFKIDNHTGFNEILLTQMFKDEIARTGRPLNSESRIGIIDEKPEQQRLYAEFLVYQSFLERNGLRCDILDIAETDRIQSASLIYNRYTDFYLQNEASKKIRELFNSAQVDLSPHPYEYFLLADKQRFLDWNTQQEVSQPSSLLPCYDLAHAEKEKIWSERKNLFFKPKNSYGSKQVYKGAAISRKMFDGIFNENFLAQQISVPSTIKAEFEGQNLELKYDLRCYAYRDQLQLIIARLYQGQTTNLKTPGGGFSCVRVSG